MTSTFSIYALSRQLGVTERRLAKALAEVPADEYEGKQPRFRLSTAVAALTKQGSNGGGAQDAYRRERAELLSERRAMATLRRQQL